MTKPVKQFNVAHSPCESCPYRKDVPGGIWHRDEYEKLRGYDDPQTAYAPFLCHHTPEIMPTAGCETLCRGWLSVHCESVAVRLLGMQGSVTADQVYAPPPIELHESGNAAADAGIKSIKRPNRKARKIVARLIKQGRKCD